MATSSLVSARATGMGRDVEVRFNDGSAFLLHSLWLRDGCRDAGHVEKESERLLASSPLIQRLPLTIRAVDVRLERDGQLLDVEWERGVPARSTFEAGFLRALAPLAGKQIAGPAAREVAFGFDFSFFEFLNGKNDTLCPKPEDLRLWNASDPLIPRVKYSELKAGGPMQVGSFLRSIIDPGAVIVTGMPDDARRDGSVLAAFATEFLGGLQKHPRRDNAHWLISTDETIGNSNMITSHGTRTGTNAYDTDKQLCNHTDQSLYGLPGLLLAFHCVEGEGNNSLNDGFAVAYAMRERDPEAFELLANYGLNAGRHLGYYDSGSLLFETSHRLLNLDDAGSLSRIQFHESYRTPSTVPYDVFPRYMAALQTFYEMVHSAEFQTHITLHKGDCLIMNNWRTMHGRAGLAGKQRTIVGGTVTREAFYSAVRLRAIGNAGVTADRGVGVPTALVSHLAHVNTFVPAANEAAGAAETIDMSFGELRAHLHDVGYVRVSLGAGVPLSKMERVARVLLGLRESDRGGSYNGAGGVTRSTLDGSSFLDARIGAPAELTIGFHNEMAYASSVPHGVAFAMVKQAEKGGTTLLVDNVELTKRLSPSLRAKLKGGVLYTRVLHPEAARGQPTFYASWQGAFETEDLSTAMERAAAGGATVERLPGDCLRHAKWSSVFNTHPTHGELYFSSILNRHGSWLDEHAVFGALPLAERPYHCLWADGSELSNVELAELRAVHEACTQRVQLNDGDLLVLDNLRTAHGRTPYESGPSPRKMGLMLSELVSRTHMNARL